jgi:DNA-binding transcriptional ArsR family regulator
MYCKAYNAFFQNFANRSNLSLIALLRGRSMGVCELAREAGMEQSAVSHCLKKMHSCNIVTFEKRGKGRIYSLNSGTVLPLLKLVDAHVMKNCKGCKLHG